MKPRVSRGQAASRLAPTPAARLSSQDEHIFRELMERFAVLSEMCFRFSQDIYLRTGAVPELDVEETVRRNVSIARRVFGDRFLEILATIYLKKSVGARELAAILGGLTPQGREPIPAGSLLIAEGESRLPDLNRRLDDGSGHRARERAREHSTVTRSDQAELRRDTR